MKKRSRYLFISALLMVLQVFGCVKPVFAGVNDFYFKDFTADYYLSKDAGGISHLKVKESVTAVFPDYNQNKGICRQIPYTNQNHHNVTLTSLDSSNLKLTRNGVAEPIYSIEKEFDYFNVCTGTDEYVLGEQTYLFEYEFTKVVTEFNDNGHEYQELYWDTNGNGSMQKFDSVTARLHFEDPSIFTGDTWCYVGTYGESGQDRCTITKTADVVEFKAQGLDRFENLTFDVELKAGSFAVPAPDENYTYVWLFVLLLLICVLFIFRGVRKYIKTREKANYYKGFFVKPEYQPSKKYSLAELAEIYIGDKKDAKVAMLLEMIVDKNITLKKLGRRKWSFLVNNTSDLSKENGDLLAILNDGARPEVGDEVKVERRAASTKLIKLKQSMEKKILSDLKNDALVEKKYQMGDSNKSGVVSVITMTLMLGMIIIGLAIAVMDFLSGVLHLNSTYGQAMVFEDGFYIYSFFTILITIFICVVLSNASGKYEKHTKSGLEASRFMDGLKLYIKMAEAERIKFLQSVETADTSPEGIVHLYEKLLPYAAVFGLEESWMKEMQEYCEVNEIEEPDYLLHGIVVSDMVRGLRSASSYATTASTMSSSGGGSSSGFSGGGGGGFSGGGGGGGGFSGR